MNPEPNNLPKLSRQRYEEIIDWYEEKLALACSSSTRKTLACAIRENIDLTDHMNDAVKSLKIVLAADQSIHEGRIVLLA